MGPDETERQRKAQLREIIHNLETNTDVAPSLAKFRELMLQRGDDNLVVLVLQKIHNILYISYNVEYIKTVLDVVDTERGVDEVFKILSSFSDKEDTVDVILKLRDVEKMVLFKYLRELKNRCALAKLVGEMEDEFREIVNATL